MISNTSALPGLEVKGQGSIFTSPALYKGEQNVARGEFFGAVLVNGARSSESGESRSVQLSGDGAQVSQLWGDDLGVRARVGERSRDAERGSVANQRATWRPPPGKGATWRPQPGRVCQSQCGPGCSLERQLAGESVNSLERASAIPLLLSIRAERAPVTSSR